MLQIKLPAFIRDAVVEGGTKRIEKDIRKRKLNAILDYVQTDSGVHRYQFALQSLNRAEPILFCHGERQGSEESDEIALLPEVVGKGALQELGHKTGALVAQGDELVFLLSHKITEENRHAFRVKFKPPFSQVVYLELAAEGAGSATLEMRVVD